MDRNFGVFLHGLLKSEVDVRNGWKDKSLCNSEKEGSFHAFHRVVSF